MLDIDQEHALTLILASRKRPEKISTTFLQFALDTVDRLWHSNNVNNEGRQHNGWNDFKPEGLQQLHEQHESGHV